MAINEQQFYAGAGGARGSIVTDPVDLPRWVTENAARLSVPNTNPATVHDNSSSGFFAAIDRAGAVGSIAVANTWTKFVDVVGAGFLGNVIASHGAFTGSKTIGIRIELDGVTWDWLETITTTSQAGTLLLGAVIPTSGGGRDGWFPTATRTIETADPLPDSARELVPTTELLSAGAPVLAFTQSLKVWVRNNRVGSGSQGQQAGCTYVMR